MGAELVLVVHRSAVTDVVAHVEPAAIVGLAVFDFLQHGVRPQGGIAPVGVVKEVDAGHDIWRDINQPESDQFALMSILVLSRERETAFQKGLVVLVSIDLTKRPLTAVVHVEMIAIVQRQMLVADRRLADDQCNIAHGVQTSALALRCGELGQDNSQALARGTCGARRPEQRSTKTTPAAGQEFFVAAFAEPICQSVRHFRGLAREVRTGRVRSVDFQFPGNRSLYELVVVHIFVTRPRLRRFSMRSPADNWPRLTPS